ncbi:hypothetical protein BMS3Abin10_02368 [bacterium BMS3Abin10]|nr:hypothetical protein BMS3Abin10_02368 [bacterium BMS3Abin10]GBE39704.1 hypothetical protein BMS3Bbin08_02335 [bacterium BMS3Bbin08]
MPIRNFPFLTLTPDNFPRPWLQVTITNPHTGKKLSSFGLIDTGADECTVPAFMAWELGHNLARGVKKEIGTAGGKAIAYTHTTSIKIRDARQKGNDVVYIIPDTPIDFAEGLDCVLLGVNLFLDNFILTVDYPKQVFSLHKP